MAEKYADQAFVEYIVKMLVNNPDKVEVTRTVDEMGVLLTLKVDPQDMGLVIGKRGVTAKSIRFLARIIGIKNNARVNFKIEEPEGSTRVAPSRDRMGMGDDSDDMLRDLNM